MTRAGFRLPGALDVTAQLSASADRLEDYVLNYGPAATDGVDYSGNRIALFPTHQARLRVQKSIGRAKLGLGARRVGTIYLDNSENERKDPAARQAPGYLDKKIEPFTLADFQAELELRRAGSKGRSAALLLHVDNLFDERYTASGYSYDQPYFYPGATRSVYAGLRIGF